MNADAEDIDRLSPPEVRVYRTAVRSDGAQEATAAGRGAGGRGCAVGRRPGRAPVAGRPACSANQPYKEA